MSDKQAKKRYERAPETDEVLRRIGRNVVNFQEVELLLKHLNAHSTLHAPFSQVLVQVEKQAASVHRNTMGDLANKLIAKLQTQDEHQTPDEIDEPWFGFTFTVGTDAQFLDRHAEEMAELVNSRNDLIHHFFTRWVNAVEGDTESALAYLDTQLEQTRRMSERLRQWAEAMDETKRQMASFFASPEGIRHLELAPLQSSRLVVMLGEIAMRKARADGWTFLSTAEHIIRKEAPEELVDLQERFGLRNLKGVLLAAEFFETVEEPLSGGGTRTVYRISDRYELTLSSNP